MAGLAIMSYFQSALEKVSLEESFFCLSQSIRHETPRFCVLQSFKAL
jgi:hypothetical protein